VRGGRLQKVREVAQAEILHHGLGTHLLHLAASLGGQMRSGLLGWLRRGLGWARKWTHYVMLMRLHRVCEIMKIVFGFFFGILQELQIKTVTEIDSL